MSAPAVEARSLTRAFGDFVAVDNISFTVTPGEVFGFLGPNGCGKTTTIRMLCGIIEPTAGDATVLGFDIRREALAIRQRIGYMSQRFALYDDLTPRENITFYAGLYGVPGRERGRRIGSLISSMGLTDIADHRVGDLPSGARQRTAFATAIVHQPPILFLDEPTAAVDPAARRAFWDTIYEIASTGTTVFVTTHFMDEAEYCGRMALMSQGRLIVCDSPARIRASIGAGMREVLCDAPARGLDAIVDQPWVRAATLIGRAIHVLLADEGSDAAIAQALAANGVGVEYIRPTAPTLEDAFVALTSAPAATA
ncbi:MAG: ABC transporter ATP-binding protein [Chloroflexota bacterium]|nr:MAG: ABC transporter ATP-binding protein [Chloroflexota bacterium]